MPTMLDVAHRAGVSIATVSAVVNHSKYVSPELRQRVQDAIRELGYRRNAIATSLASRRTNTVGIVLPRLTSPLYPPMVSAIEKALGAQSYRIILCDSEEKQANERQQLEILQEKQVDGLVVVPAGSGNLGLLRQINAHAPVVLADRRLPGEFDSVASDNLAAAHQATAHLIAHGHRRIAVLAFSDAISSAQERVAGYRQAMQEADLPAEGLVKLARYPEQRTVKPAVEQLFAGSKAARPDAILALNDISCLCAWDVLKELGLRVPDDVGLVGFDDSPWAAHTEPPLTMVRQDPAQIGKRAALLLLTRLSDRKPSRPLPPQALSIPTALVVRRSAGEAKEN